MGAMDEIRINRVALADAMEKRGVGIVALSKKARVHKNTIRQMLRGQCPSRIDAAMRVAHVLGLLLADLLILEDGGVRKGL